MQTVHNLAGTELARLPMKGPLIIDYSEFYQCILSKARRDHEGWCPVKFLYKMFSPKHSVRVNPDVVLAIKYLKDIHLLELDYDDKDVLKGVRPLESFRNAESRLPKYTSALEVIAGLEAFDELLEL